MATGWFWSLHCKTNAIDDVITTNPPSLSSRFSCARAQSLRDSILFFSKPKPASAPTKPKPDEPKPAIIPPSLSSISPPSLTSLPLNHSSRRVVELIFLSSWASTGDDPPFNGEISMVFRIHNPIRAVAQFEQYRARVRTDSSKSDPRCAADGNEMMRFLNGLSHRNGSKIRTFAGSGGAHKSVSGSGLKRTMMVCRVIAGRVRDGDETGSEFGSVKKGEDEILVFDRRAVLPCFLIIYKL
ncbi:hypothetical protein LUZ60_016810 [Juncus effusus]|nr:hypothetical protein LUZ60_016810 [Juncus effusus]